MKKVIVISSLLLAISFTAVAQIAGPTQQEEQNAFGASAPSAAFQSTSSMSGSGSTYSANPELNADGTAAYNDEPTTYSPARAPQNARPRKLPGNPQPIGDAVLPLMLIACAYAIYKVRSRSRSANGSQERYHSASSEVMIND